MIYRFTWTLAGLASLGAAVLWAYVLATFQPDTISQAQANLIAGCGMAAHSVAGLAFIYRALTR